MQALDKLKSLTEHVQRTGHGVNVIRESSETGCVVAYCSGCSFTRYLSEQHDD